MGIRLYARTCKTSLSMGMRNVSGDSGNCPLPRSSKTCLTLPYLTLSALPPSFSTLLYQLPVLPEYIYKVVVYKKLEVLGYVCSPEKKPVTLAFLLAYACSPLSFIGFFRHAYDFWSFLILSRKTPETPEKITDTAGLMDRLLISIGWWILTAISTRGRHGVE